MNRFQTDGRLGHEAASLLASQRMYYDLRADDYGDVTRPDRRGGPGLMDTDLARSLIDEFRPTGHVLELACGTGGFTTEIVRHAKWVTAVDGSARMLSICRDRVNAPMVSYVLADVFAWKPDRAYDAVFFGNWLSHVPPSLFDDFWMLVANCLAPHGRVAFVDEDERAAGFEDGGSIGGIPAARRTLRDGRRFDIVKVFWRSEDLERRLLNSGWEIMVRPLGETYMFGSGCRAR